MTRYQAEQSFWTLTGVQAEEMAGRFGRRTPAYHQMIGEGRRSRLGPGCAAPAFVYQASKKINSAGGETVLDSRTQATFGYTNQYG